MTKDKIVPFKTKSKTSRDWTLDEALKATKDGVLKYNGKGMMTCVLLNNGDILYNYWNLTYNEVTQIATRAFFDAVTREVKNTTFEEGRE